jgi:hypothetical protein
MECCLAIKLTSNREPILRERAHVYLFVTLISFAGSVSVTRLFLELTGYPQIGSGNIHIAHVLWGGLILFIAALLPLIFSNRWALDWSAILTGVGVGLFIDEVGKFITRTNDYFTPSAAPIIYSFFLLTVLIYLEVRRRRKYASRALMYEIFEDLEEVLDHDLSDREYKALNGKLAKVVEQTDQPELRALAVNIQQYLQSNSIKPIPHIPTFWEKSRTWLEGLENRWLDRSRSRVLLGSVVIAWGILCLSSIINLFMTTRSSMELQTLLLSLANRHLVNSATRLTWFEMHVGLEGSMGLVFILAAILLLLKKDRYAIGVIVLGLLTNLTIVNLLLFYFDQFSSIIGTIIQFAILFLAVRYRNRFLSLKPRH